MKVEYLKALLKCQCQNAIVIWKFRDAPEEYQGKSENGGDEDWIAFVPDGMKDDYIGFLEEGSAFGCCCVEEHDVDGGRIYIGCHS